MDTPNPHTWHTPGMIAAQLSARPTRDGWATTCPAHGGDNPRAFSIKEGVDKAGQPCTLLYCHTHQCDIRDICDALGITVAQLFCSTPRYRDTMRYCPRGHDPRLERLRWSQTPHSADDLAQAMLESEIVNDGAFLSHCPSARETYWRLWQDPTRKPGLVKALIEAELPVRATLESLREEWGAHESRDAP